MVVTNWFTVFFFVKKYFYDEAFAVERKKSSFKLTQNSSWLAQLLPFLKWSYGSYQKWTNKKEEKSLNFVRTELYLVQKLVLVLEIVLFFTFFKSNIRLQIVQFLQIMKPSILYFLVYDRYSFFCNWRSAAGHSKIKSCVCDVSRICFLSCWRSKLCLYKPSSVRRKMII